MNEMAPCYELRTGNVGTKSGRRSEYVADRSSRLLRRAVGRDRSRGTDASVVAAPARAAARERTHHRAARAPACPPPPEAAVPRRKRAAAPPRGFHRARRGSHPWRTGNTGSGARPRTGHLPRPPLSDEVPRTFSAIARQAAPAIRRRSGPEGIPCPARATSPCASPLPKVDREHLRICPDPRPRHRGPLGRHPPYRPALPARRRGKRRARDRRAHPAGEVCAPSRRDLPGESERDAPTARPEDGRAEQEI